MHIGQISFHAKFQQRILKIENHVAVLSFSSDFITTESIKMAKFQNLVFLVIVHQQFAS